MVDLYPRFERMVRKCGPVSLTPTTGHIAFRALVQFAGVQVQKDGLRIGLLMRRRLESPRFVKVSTFSPGSHVHSPILRAPEDLDDELQGWLNEAYEGGNLLQRSRPAKGTTHSRSQKGA